MRLYLIGKCWIQDMIQNMAAHGKSLYYGSQMLCLSPKTICSVSLYFLGTTNATKKSNYDYDFFSSFSSY